MQKPIKQREYKISRISRYELFLKDTGEKIVRDQRTIQLKFPNDLHDAAMLLLYREPNSNSSWRIEISIFKLPLEMVQDNGEEFSINGLLVGLKPLMELSEIITVLEKNGFTEIPFKSLQ